MSQSAKWRRLLGSFLVLVVSSCSTGGSSEESAPDRVASRRTHESLHSVLWTQTSVEYRALTLQSYRRAQAMLDEALSDPSWTAALEQTGEFTELPPAVILDVDETVLDNSLHQARLVQNAELFNTETWNAWCREKKAPPIPGALEFTRYAADKGVTVFYVTNRRHVVEEPTRENMKALGFPIDQDGEDTLYTRGEREAWQDSDKASRRIEVASRYRILLLVGDNLGDFVSGVDVSLAERDSLFESHQANWGTRWIVLPNPQYGSWEGALIDFDYSLSDEERLRRKFEALKTE